MFTPSGSSRATQPPPHRLIGGMRMLCRSTITLRECTRQRVPNAPAPPPPLLPPHRSSPSLQQGERGRRHTGLPCRTWRRQGTIGRRRHRHRRARQRAPHHRPLRWRRDGPRVPRIGGWCVVLAAHHAPRRHVPAAARPHCRHHRLQQGCGAAHPPLTMPPVAVHRRRRVVRGAVHQRPGPHGRPCPAGRVRPLQRQADHICATGGGGGVVDAVTK
jgi:hypothetical protein